MLAGLAFNAPLATQTRGAADPEDEAQAPQPLPAPTTRAGSGRTAATGSGVVGQRQTRGEAGPNVAPLGRLDSRVSNRVQNRIRNRIDRDYDPRANATSPFRVADEQARAAGQRPRR